MSDSLIKELEEKARRTDLPFERRLIDTAVWFHQNKDRIPRENLAKRVDFLEKTLDIMLELTAMSLERLHSVEGRPRSSKLWVPSGVQINGDIRKFG